MKLTKCSKNPYHFYDGDKFTECPQCREALAGMSGTAASAPAVEEDYRTVVKGRTRPESDAREDDARTVLKGRMFGGWGRSRKAEPAAQQPEDDERTVLLRHRKPQPEAQEQTAAEPAAQQPEDDGRTVLLRHRKPQPEVREQTAAEPAVHPEYVAGWLVCVRGAYMGQSFPLKCGRSCIGRNAWLDVVLDRDTGVCADCHTMITFEPQLQKFIIQPGEGGGTTLVNDAVLSAPQQLQELDSIRIGGCSFVFKVLCGAQFSWKEYME